MKAFLLSAGLGTRLRPLTNEVPKCLLPIAGTTLIDIWIDKLKKVGIEEILVNIHHMPEKMARHLEKYSSDTGLVLSYEETLLGSAGTLKANRKFIGSSSSFLVCNADTLTTIDLCGLIASHKKRQSIVTLALVETDKPEAMGIVEMDDTGLIISFEEKPDHPKSNLAYAGIAVMNDGIFEYLEPEKVLDIGNDLLPKLAGKSQGVVFNEYLRDIGTPESYKAAQEEWRELEGK